MRLVIRKGFMDSEVYIESRHVKGVGRSIVSGVLVTTIATVIYFTCFVGPNDRELAKKYQNAEPQPAEYTIE